MAVEMALRAYKGKVYAIEKKELAVELLKKNKEQFQADNLEIIEGFAPEAMEDLEAPTHAFIGGLHSGNMKEIMELLLKEKSKGSHCYQLYCIGKRIGSFGMSENFACVRYRNCADDRRKIKNSRQISHDDGRKPHLHYFLYGKLPVERIEL